MSARLHNAAEAGQNVATDYLARLADLLRLVPRAPLAALLELLLEAQRTGRRVYVLGNGGSAATASHFVCDFAKTARVDGRRPLRAFALTDSATSLTAWANDADYARVFAEQLDAHLEPGDVVIAISASGNSPNILAGLAVAIERGAHTAALVGFDGGRAALLADVVIHIPSDDYGRVEDVHMAIGHALTAAIRDSLNNETG